MAALLAVARGSARKPRLLALEWNGGAQGERPVAFVGKIGSGKSTILRCINGLESYESGDILVEGLRVDRNAPSIVSIRTQVSMVFQHFGLLPHRKVVDNVAFGLEVRGENKSQRRNRAQEMVDLVGLTDFVAFMAYKPEWRRQEALTFVKKGLEDFSISREKARLSWGVAVPDDDTRVMYVWFDALVNYISAIGWPITSSAFSSRLSDSTRSW